DRSPAPLSGSSDFFVGVGTGASRDTRMPADRTVRLEIVPALLETLAEESNPDLITAALVALAKVGEAPGDDVHQRTIARYLSHPSQEVRQTAAVSLGILASDSALDLLEALVRNSEAGRAAVAATQVDARTQAFAAYGLGLLGARTQSEDTRRRIARIVVEELPHARRMAQQDLAIALVVSLGLTPLVVLDDSEPRTDPEPLALSDPTLTRQGQVRFLLAQLADPGLNFLLRAQLPTAIARLLPGLGDQSRARAEAVAALLALLDPRSKERHAASEIRWGAVVALGEIGDCDGDPADRAIRAALLEDAPYLQRQGRFFALISMAKIAARPGSGEQANAGRDPLVEALVAQLAQGTGGANHWGALALGVFGRAVQQSGATPSAKVGELLAKELEAAKSVEDVAPFAIANGLFAGPQARALLSSKLTSVEDPKARGYVCLGLGLLGDVASADAVEGVLEGATYLPFLLRQSALALGLLGDYSSIDTLIRMLDSARSLPTQSAITAALGRIGDRRAIRSLIGAVEDPTRTGLARGFAAAALGIVGDKELLPWNTKLAIGVNYRATLPTLSDVDGRGVLNLL
ncbi:MAG: HEAT repeat domain-containing protein, partial [Planctomycetota bacterium]